MISKISEKLDDMLFKRVGPVSERHGRSGTHEEWEAYRSRCKVQCPILYRLSTIVDSIECFFAIQKRKIYNDPIWYLKNIFKHPKWFVRPRTQRIGWWYDSDARILHANMQILVEFIENELGGRPWEVEEYEAFRRGEPSCNFDGDGGKIFERQCEDKVKAWEIYQWWMQYDKRKEDIEKAYDDIPNRDGIGMFSKKSRDLCRPYYDVIHQMEKTLLEEENENLKTLMEIRSCLWA